MSARRVAIAKTNDVREGEMKSFDVGEDKILISKIDGEFYAIGAVCPHYGADLADGVLSGERVVCPWHHAAYNAKTGDLEEPPSLDAVPRYDLEIEGDDLVLLLPEEMVQSRKPDMVKGDPQGDNRTFVIIGAGSAGNAAAQTLREDGFKGRVVMITRENRLPYDRPQLSKEYLEGKSDEDALPLRSKGFYAKYDIEVMLETEVTAVDLANKTLFLAPGDKLQYDSLLLAPGAVPRRLDVPGADLINVFTLRSFEDSTAIVQAAEHASKAVIIGGGFIGIETAYSLSQRNLSVTVVTGESVPFEGIFGKEIGQMFQKMHEENRVEFKLNSRVAKIEGDKTVEAVVLEGGERIQADLVVVGIGVKPATEFLRGIDLLSDGSLKVDEYFRAGADVYAAGDVATFPEHYSGRELRIEHWRTAQQQGRIAAHNMAGKKVPYRSIPFFWTTQGDLYFRYVGHATQWDDIIVHGDVSSRVFIAFYVSNNRVVAAAGNNHEKEMAAIEELMRLGKMPSAEELRNHSVDLVALLKK
ncbi:MAG: FAD-dependent oxidoreductase [Desulfomonile tiedjei]|nr:FAD-dependent oxidoreductase [Desulfomonile tiedjei]